MKVTIQIDGMSCQKCCSSIENALYQQDGIQRVEILLQQKTAVIEFVASQVSIATISEIIESLGFDVLVI